MGKNKSKGNGKAKDDGLDEIDKALQKLNTEDTQRANAKKQKRSKKGKHAVGDAGGSGGQGEASGASSHQVAEPVESESVATDEEVNDDEGIDPAEATADDQDPDRLRLDTLPQDLPTYDEEPDLEMAPQTELPEEYATQTLQHNKTMSQLSSQAATGLQHRSCRKTASAWQQQHPRPHQPLPGAPSPRARTAFSTCII